MKRLLSKMFLGLTILPAFVVFTGCSKNKDEVKPNDDVVVVNATGDINPQLDAFRQLLGDQLNTTPGVVGGRREINWDGVPDALLNKKLPENFFNPVGEQASVTNQRGLVYSAAGNFQVSKTNFAEVNASAGSELSSFSGNKIFANVSANKWDVEFQVPSKTFPASVKGFGIVFSDVDLPKSTSLEFFDGEKSLGKFFAPAKNSSNFSFLGVYFKNEKVTLVRVEHQGQLDQGQADISNNGTVDLVAMDNFLYNEPVKN
ncbi:MAG: hypothetical protein ABI675_26970 [Chitinophagaceae bacterium]